MNDRPTPETDSAMKYWPCEKMELVDSAFARRLERERDEAREDATNYFAKIGELERERNEAREPAAWIPVARALPDDDATVLIHLADGGVEAGFLDAGAWRFVSGDRVQSPVLHWRPFPDAPPPSK